MLEKIMNAVFHRMTRKQANHLNGLKARRDLFMLERYYSIPLKRERENRLKVYNDAINRCQNALRRKGVKF